MIIPLICSGWTLLTHQPNLLVPRVFLAEVARQTLVFQQLLKPIHQVLLSHTPTSSGVLSTPPFLLELPQLALALALALVAQPALALALAPLLTGDNVEELDTPAQPLVSVAQLAPFSTHTTPSAFKGFVFFGFVISKRIVRSWDKFLDTELACIYTEDEDFFFSVFTFGGFRSGGFIWRVKDTA
jgi:hypothetical protein